MNKAFVYTITCYKKKGTGYFTFTVDADDYREAMKQVNQILKDPSSYDILIHSIVKFSDHPKYVSQSQ